MSVLPSSTTSGASVPAKAVSSRWNRLDHCWYSTLTVALVAAVNRAGALSTTSFQPDWASTMSHTLMVLPSPLRLPVSAVLGVVVLLHAAAPMSVAATAAAIAICRLTRPPCVMGRLGKWTTGASGKVRVISGGGKD